MLRIGDYVLTVIEDATQWGGCRVYAARKKGWTRSKVVFTFCTPPGEQPYLAYALVDEGRFGVVGGGRGGAPRSVRSGGVIRFSKLPSEWEIEEKMREVLETGKFRRFLEPLDLLAVASQL